MASSTLSSSPLLPTHPLRRRLLPAAAASSSSISLPSLQSHWSSADADITTHLLRSLPPSPFPAVTNPMLHLLSSAPPSAAPSLCLAACELSGDPRHLALNAASALRLVHAAAHAHADLLLRRRHGLAATYPDGIVLLTADGLLPLGFEMAAASGGGEADPAAAVRVVAEIAGVAGAAAEGRLLEAEGGEEEKVVEGTEGAMGACGAACGAILAGGEEAAVERMRRFGFYAGMMYGFLVREGKGKGKAEGFWKRAKKELEGLEEGKADVARELLDFWYEERREKKGPGASLLPLQG